MSTSGSAKCPPTSCGLACVELVDLAIPPRIAHVLFGDSPEGVARSGRCSCFPAWTPAHSLQPAHSQVRAGHRWHPAAAAVPSRGRSSAHR